MVGFQPLNHNKQKCNMFPNNNHEEGPLPPEKSTSPCSPSSRLNASALRKGPRQAFRGRGWAGSCVVTPRGAVIFSPILPSHQLTWFGAQTSVERPLSLVSGPFCTWWEGIKIIWRYLVLLSYFPLSIDFRLHEMRRKR